MKVFALRYLLFIFLEHRHRRPGFRRFQTEMFVVSGDTVTPTPPGRLAAGSLNIDFFVDFLLSQTVCKSIHFMVARAIEHSADVSVISGYLIVRSMILSSANSSRYNHRMEVFINFMLTLLEGQQKSAGFR